jgi:hypothetical protein
MQLCDTLLRPYIMPRMGQPLLPEVNGRVELTSLKDLERSVKDKVNIALTLCTLPILQGFMPAFMCHGCVAACRTT